MKGNQQRTLHSPPVSIPSYFAVCVAYEPHNLWHLCVDAQPRVEKVALHGYS